MQLKKIITLANKNVYLRFTAMERSLRATGCNLPLWVLPYNNDLFELPPNAQWVDSPELFGWLDSLQLRGVYRKYYCLLQEGYLFVDSDVIFLRNPQKALNDVEGYITSCGHWHNTVHTTTAYSEIILRGRCTIWQARIFNSGQFACSNALYQLPGLHALAQQHAEVCLHRTMHEQPGVNLLVNLSGEPITNLTLPPHSMESTWAGDYTMDDYEKYWTDEKRKPFIIHWAGRGGQLRCKIDYLFFKYLTEEEKRQWKPATPKQKNRWHHIKQKWKGIIQSFIKSKQLDVHSKITNSLLVGTFLSFSF